MASYSGGGPSPSRIGHAGAEPGHPDPAQRLGSGCPGDQRLTHAPQNQEMRHPARSAAASRASRRGCGAQHLMASFAASSAARSRPQRSRAAVGIAVDLACRQPLQVSQGATRGPARSWDVGFIEQQAPHTEEQTKRVREVTVIPAGRFARHGRAIQVHRARASSGTSTRMAQHGAGETPCLETHLHRGPNHRRPGAEPRGVETPAGGSMPARRPAQKTPPTKSRLKLGLPRPQHGGKPEVIAAPPRGREMQRRAQ